MEREAPFLASIKVRPKKEEQVSGGSGRYNSTPPRLIFHLFPGDKRESIGMQTPPLRPPGSIPFQWEDAPGRPKQKPSPAPVISRPIPPPPAGRILPPRLAATMAEDPKEKNTSPITCHAFLLMKSGSFRDSREVSGARGKGYKDAKVSWGWRRKKGKVAFNGFKDSSRSVATEPTEGISPSSSSSATSSSSSALQDLWKETNSRLRRSMSTGDELSSFSAPLFWGDIYGNLKQLVSRRK